MNPNLRRRFVDIYESPETVTDSESSFCKSFHLAEIPITWVPELTACNLLEFPSNSDLLGMLKVC